MEDVILTEAKKYAGFKDSVDPNDSDERYYQENKCKLYDAFIAGADAYKKLLSNDN